MKYRCGACGTITKVGSFQFSSGRCSNCNSKLDFEYRRFGLELLAIVGSFCLTFASMKLGDDAFRELSGIHDSGGGFGFLFGLLTGSSVFALLMLSIEEPQKKSGFVLHKLLGPDVSGSLKSQSELKSYITWVLAAVILVLIFILVILWDEIRLTESIACVVLALSWALLILPLLARKGYRVIHELNETIKEIEREESKRIQKKIP